MTKLKNIFDKKMGTDLEMVRMEKVEKKTSNSINFVSRTSKNNGVSGIVKKKHGIEPSPPHTLSIAMGGSVLSTFYQDESFYSGRDLYCLIPKTKLTKKEMLFYATFIQSYKELYNYGRQANKTFMDLLVPEKHEIPSWVYETEIPDYSDIVEPKENKVVELPDSSKWKEFSFNELFEIGKAKGPKAKEAENNIGIHPYITATAQNNGIKCYTSIEPQHKGNCLTIGHLGDPFYQEKDFSGNNVTYLYSKTKTMNQYIGLFLVSLLEFLPKKYNYGNVVGITKMKNEKISLPVDSNGNPDWQLMEDYIKSLPYSLYI